MDADMRPDVVSELLNSVEAKWTQEALNVLENQTDEKVAYAAMESSCVKVSSAIVQGSDGDRLNVIEYMRTVCNEPNAKSNLAMCAEFGNAIQQFMIGDEVYNRDQLDMHDFCKKFWSTSITEAAKAQKKKLDEEEKKRLAEEKKKEEEEAEQRRKLAEEAAKKAEQEAEEAAKKAEQEAEERKKLAEAEEKKKLAEEVANNNTSLTLQNTSQNTSAIVAKNDTSLTVTNPGNVSQNVSQSASIAKASTNATNAAVTTQMTSTEGTAPVVSNRNETETLKNVTSQTSAQNATKVQDAGSQALKNTSKLMLKDGAVTVAAEDKQRNTSQAPHNNTQLALKNANVTTEDKKLEKIQGKLTNQVVKQLKLVLNHTRNSMPVVA